jgi:hypothetical protein
MGDREKLRGIIFTPIPRTISQFLRKFNKGIGLRKLKILHHLRNKTSLTIQYKQFNNSEVKNNETKTNRSNPVKIYNIPRPDKPKIPANHILHGRV